MVRWIRALASFDEKTVGSVQQFPATGRPYKIRAHGTSASGKTYYRVEVFLSQDQAKKLCEDWVSMGLFGRHGRIITTEKLG